MVGSPPAPGVHQLALPLLPRGEKTVAQAVTFVIVDRNAIHANDQDGGDRPAIVIGGDAPLPPCHVRELEILDQAGAVVGRFKSQSRGRPVDSQRPHVWFELEVPYSIRYNEGDFS